LGLRQQKLAVDCGHWPLYRYRPAAADRVVPEFVLDSQPPSIPLEAYAYNETRYKMLSYTNPEEAKRLLALAQQDIHQHWAVYKSMSDRWPGSSRAQRQQAGCGK
ncbi:MAG TPA: hypothetical protein VH439_10785, partial [Gemmatimonadales bacterium]